jgi:site-specific recombinase XerD
MDDHQTPAPAGQQLVPSAPDASTRVQIYAATKASNDAQLLDSWIKSMNSSHTRRNFGTTARRFLDLLAEAGCTLRTATIEDVRDALELLVAGLAKSSARQAILRCKSLMTFAHKLGFTQFNAGVPIKVDPLTSNLSKRIVGEGEVGSLVRSAIRERDYLMLAIGYAAALRVSELVALNCGDPIMREINGERRVQFHIVGKGRRERDLLLPADLSERLLAFIAGKPANAPIFGSSKKGRETERLTTRGANFLIKRVARKCAVTERVSPHWLRHAHASHALDRGAALHEVQATLGHANVSTTSGYLHARPGRSTADNLDASLWRPRQGRGLNGVSRDE